MNTTSLRSFRLRFSSLKNISNCCLLCETGVDLYDFSRGARFHVLDDVENGQLYLNLVESSSLKADRNWTCEIPGNSWFGI